MESISIAKGATSVKKEAEKVQRQKSFVFAQIPHAFIQCIAMHCRHSTHNFWNFPLVEPN